MREIEFRTYGKGNGCMEYCTLKELANKDTFDINFNDYEWMQFTGLKDKNGKEIYEGDIVCFKWDGIYWKENYIGKITFQNGAFWFDDSPKEYDTLNEYEPEDLGIIGDIYSNPGLLEDE